MKWQIFFVLMLLVIQITRAYGAENVSYNSGGRRDPMAPLIDENGRMFQTSDSASVHIEGIIYDPRNVSIAVVNGESYKVGDSLGGYIIKSIQKNSVVFEQDGEQKIFFLNDPSLNDQKGYGSV